MKLVVFLLVAIVSVASIEATCDGMNKVQQCLTGKLPNLTQIAEEVKTCANKCGCTYTNSSTGQQSTNTKNNGSTNWWNQFKQIFNGDKVKECYRIFNPIVRSAIESCVQKNISDYHWPAFDLGNKNSSFFGGDYNLSQITCPDNAWDTFKQCVNGTSFPNMWDAVCKAETSCQNELSVGNQCTVNDLKQLVFNCTDIGLQQRQAELNSAVNQCLGGASHMKIFNSNTINIILSVVKTMGNGCNMTTAKPTNIDKFLQKTEQVVDKVINKVEDFFHG